jgi:predicted secreted hydrolase
MSGVFIECWHCNVQVTLAERSDEDGFCPHCMCELDLEDYLVQSVAAIDTLRTANQRLEGDLALALKVPSVAAMHSYLDTECAKQNAQLGEDKQRLEGEVKALREALEKIEQDDWQSSQTATDFAISQTKGMLISRMKQTARAALRGNGGE